MSSSFGKKLKVTVFGQSHSEAIGVVIDGLPAGKSVDMENIMRFLSRRAPGQNAYSTARKEADIPVIVSGLMDGKTCGAPLAALIDNQNTRPADYEKIRTLPRPSHADYPAFMKYGDAHDFFGGGHFSGRLTAPLCFAGAICLDFLASRGITVGAHIASVGQVADPRFDPVSLTADQLHAPGKKAFPVISDIAGEQMQKEIAAAKAQGNSVGGVVECGVTGLPAGVGEPIFCGVENHLAAALFAIPAVKGLEFGDGFAAAARTGSQNNDPYIMQDGEIRTKTNHAGGILGGLATGMPLLFRVAFKPTPSIGLEQQTVNLKTREPAKLIIGGRHDPCIVPRAVPCVEAAAAIALLDLLLS